MRRCFIGLLLLLCTSALAQNAVDTIQRGAAITLKVESFQRAKEELAELVRKHQGVFADRQQLSSEGGRHSGWTRVIVPKPQLDAFVADVRGLGKIYGERMTLENHGSVYVELGQRAQRLKEHEQRLSNILTSRRGLRGSDLLYVQERLYRASTDEDSLLERRDAIPLRAAKSSVIVDLFEPTPVKEVPRGALGHIKAAFTGAFRGLAFGLLGWVGPILNLLVVAFVLFLLYLPLRRPIRSGIAALKRSFEPPPTSTTLDANQEV